MLTGCPGPATPWLSPSLSHPLSRGGGVLVFATAFSLAIPWTVKRAVDMLTAGADRHAGRVFPAHPGLAVLHDLARLGSRFATDRRRTVGGARRRRDLYASFLRRPPAFYQNASPAISCRATSDVSNVRALAGFGGTMLVATTLAFAGTLAAMWTIDPWLTLWALSPSPLLVLATKRFELPVDEQSVAVQERLGVLSAKVQENLTGVPVVRAYTMETREIESFGRLGAEYMARWPAPGPHSGGLLASDGPGGGAELIVLAR